MSLIDRIKECQRWDPARYRPFRIEGLPLGWLSHQFADRLKGFPLVFVVSPEAVELAPGLRDFEARSRAVEEVLRRLKEEGLIKGWREEPYPVGASLHADPLMKMERAAVPLFGLRAYGVHLNGFVGKGEGLRLWVARRSATKQTAPGKLDHIVGGGQPMGLSLMENLIKECAEEAAMPERLARKARPAGFVSYVTERVEGLRNDICYAYDIELPVNFAPRNTDGEIEWFQLWPVAEVKARLAEGDDFKFNVALVNIDFLVRRGYLGPDEPDYVEIVEGLRLRRSGA
jgi:isopentenyldiphosphate isomerase